jgi:hypothetical protein
MDILYLEPVLKVLASSFGLIFLFISLKIFVNMPDIAQNFQRNEEQISSKNRLADTFKTGS